MAFPFNHRSPSYTAAHIPPPPVPLASDSQEFVASQQPKEEAKQTSHYSMGSLTQGIASIAPVQHFESEELLAQELGSSEQREAQYSMNVNLGVYPAEQNQHRTPRSLAYHPGSYKTGSLSANSSEFGAALDQLLHYQPSLARNLSLGHLSAGYIPERLNHSCEQLPFLTSSPSRETEQQPLDQASPQTRPHRHSIDLSALMRHIAKRKNSSNYPGKLNTSFQFYPRTPTTLEPHSSAAATYSGNVLSVDSERENLLASPHSQLQEAKQLYSSPLHSSMPRSYFESPTTQPQFQSRKSFFVKTAPIWDVPGKGEHPIHLNLDFFKTQPCSLAYQHNHKHCPFFHSNKDQRRPPSQFKYQHEMCKRAQREMSCVDECKFSHNRVQRLYHPDKYKTKFCTHYPQNLSLCEYDDFCCFAHSERDIKVPLLHLMNPKDMDFYLFYFKTAWCPFTKDHNKAQCVYAHNWQDFRRKPHLFDYQHSMCPNWKSGTFIMAYEEGCNEQWRCGFCHGWKQKQFHPHNYKTSPCPYRRSSKSCPGRQTYFQECPFYHEGATDKRSEYREQMFNIHRVKPKQREDICWDRDWVIWTNNINDMKEKLIDFQERNVYAGTPPLIERSVSQSGAQSSQNTHQRRLSLDVNRLQNQKLKEKYSKYFKPFENSKNLLYFDLEKKEESKNNQEHVKPFKSFSPLISGLKFGRKHSLDYPPAFSLEPSYFKHQSSQIQNSLNKSLALDDTGVDDLLKESSRAGLEAKEEEEEGQVRWDEVLKD